MPDGRLRALGAGHHEPISHRRNVQEVRIVVRGGRGFDHGEVPWLGSAEGGIG